MSSRDKGQQQTEQLSTELAQLKTSLRQTELRLSLTGVESLVNISKYTYPVIEATADYERAQASTASIANLIEQEAFIEAEDAISEAQKFADTLYQLAQENQKVEAEARTRAHVSIGKAEVIIQRAQYFNANQHAPEQFQEATSRLKRAQQGISHQSLPASATICTTGAANRR